MATVIDIRSPRKKNPLPDRPIMLSDLNNFRSELLLQIRQIVQHPAEAPKRWIKSYQVKQILGISHGTLQSLRASGAVPFSRLGGTIYYDEEEINRVLVLRQAQLARKHKFSTK